MTLCRGLYRTGANGTVYAGMNRNSAGQKKKSSVMIMQRGEFYEI